MSPSTPLLRIGQLARLSGASPKALRLYEALGLLSQPARQGAYRVYTQEHADVVCFIRQAQALGFKLKELHALAQKAPLLKAVELGLASEAVRLKRDELAVRQRALRAQEKQLAAFEALLAQARESACDCPRVTHQA
jgi:MerR family copper efflux transcriptional regulator